ncbi:MAG: type 4a pilus biogenesis protein PilO [Acidobacteriia bacterium]|nr:type 4a pilus biogenesis protein PilO [Terriglobia bacterium]
MALEKLSGLPWYLQLLIFVGIAVLLVLGVEYGYFHDMAARIDEQKTELTALQAELANIQEVQRQHDQFQRSNVRLRQQLADMHSVLPVDRSVDVLIRQLQDIATLSHVQLMRLAAKTPASRETTAPAAGKKGEPAPQLYNEIPFTLELAGSYNSLGLFFDRVAHMARIVNISDLAMSGLANASRVHLKVKPQTGVGDTVVASCTATTYYQPAP